MIKKIVPVFLAVWFLLWANFILRELFYSGNLAAYAELIKRDHNGRRAYVYGEDLYVFLNAVKNYCPARATYKLEGIENLSLDYRRSVYYLYPLTQSTDPEYVLSYNNPGFVKDGYRLVNDLGNGSTILEKIR